jgi:hypothetical protein
VRTLGGLSRTSRLVVHGARIRLWGDDDPSNCIGHRRALAKTKFVQDPVAGLKYSRATSIVSSAYKRHGRILETALREGLRESNRHQVWQESAFRVSRAADGLVSSQTEDACRQTTLPYGDSIRTIQVDMVAFDSADQSIRAYEVKRGNGQFDAGKIRSIKRDLMCVQVLLKSYGEELAQEQRAIIGRKIGDRKRSKLLKIEAVVM